jgi:hypothetical protein
MVMPKVSKSKRQMAIAFEEKYKNIPFVFLARNLDYHNNLGDCFDSVIDYKNNATQEFDFETNKWQSKSL